MLFLKPLLYWGVGYLLGLLKGCIKWHVLRTRSNQGSMFRGSMYRGSIFSGVKGCPVVLGWLNLVYPPPHDLSVVPKLQPYFVN